MTEGGDRSLDVRNCTERYIMKTSSCSSISYIYLCIIYHNIAKRLHSTSSLGASS